MKKIKLISSLSTLGIVATAVPVVATSCKDDNKEELTEVTWISGEGFSDLELERGNYVHYIPDLFSAKLGDEEQAITSIKVSSDNSNVIKVYEITKGQDYMLQADGPASTKANITLEVKSEKGNKGTSTFPVTVTPEIPEITGQFSTIKTVANGSWLPSYNYYTDLCGAIVVEDITSAVTMPLVSPISLETNDTITAYDATDTWYSNPTENELDKISFTKSSTNIQMTIGADTLGPNESYKIVYLRAKQNGTSVIAESWIALLNNKIAKYIFIGTPTSGAHTNITYNQSTYTYDVTFTKDGSNNGTFKLNLSNNPPSGTTYKVLINGRQVKDITVFVENPMELTVTIPKDYANVDASIRVEAYNEKAGVTYIPWDGKLIVTGS